MSIEESIQHPSNSTATHKNSPKPFVIEIHQDRKTPSGSFIPSASLKLMEEFRASGLLQALPPDDLKSLLYLLTFISPEGNCQVTQPILTSAMKTSSVKVKARMHRLAEFLWQGCPLIVEVPHESGIFTYSLHPHLVAYEHLMISEPYPTSPLPEERKQQVIAHSRATYARPRAEVERVIAAQMGQDIDETEEQGKLRRRLENTGLTTEQSRELLLAFPADVIAQQLDWLPYRNAKNPAGYLLAAIDGGYQEPKAIRDQRFVLEEKHGTGMMMENEALPADQQRDAVTDTDESELPHSGSVNSLPPLKIDDEALSLPEV